MADYAKIASSLTTGETLMVDKQTRRRIATYGSLRNPADGTQIIREAEKKGFPRSELFSIFLNHGVSPLVVGALEYAAETRLDLSTIQDEATLLRVVTEKTSRQMERERTGMEELLSSGYGQQIVFPAIKPDEDAPDPTVKRGF